jgi:ribose 5-phosphate isomerase A
MTIMRILISDTPDVRLVAKNAAAAAAVDLVADGMTVGLGSGTTAEIFLELLAERVRAGLHIRAVPTSSRVESMAIQFGVGLTELGEGAFLDLDVDGADEVDPALNVIKGGGGALLREKIVALASRQVVFIVDETKLVDRLAETGSVPVEVITFGWHATAERISATGGDWMLRGPVEHPFMTDGGNVILDVRAPKSVDVVEFFREIKGLTGVVEHGVFSGVADQVIVGSDSGTVRPLRR